MPMLQTTAADNGKIAHTAVKEIAGRHGESIFYMCGALLLQNKDVSGDKLELQVKRAWERVRG